LYLFTPDLDGIWSLGVWRGAFSQMFFSLSLGLGTMTAYASYLPKDADQVNNALLVSFMNCGFEYIAGVAIFSLLFAFALNPVGGTLTLAFFVIPQGIAQFPGGEAVVVGFGAAFFFLLVIAGITSSISLIESPASALIDKLGVSRAQALALVAGPGVLGSLCFTLPLVIDPALAGNGTLGLTLLDVVDHWAFGYSLITVGFFECLMIGWVFGAERLRAVVNQHTKLPLGAWFDVLIKFIAPGLLGTVIVLSLAEELSRDTLYGMIDDMSGFDWVPVVMPFVWLFGTLGMAAYLTFGRDYPEPERRATVPGEADAPRTPQTAA
jgi:NSS family neurotransmitter:Na+ symporter